MNTYIAKNWYGTFVLAKNDIVCDTIAKGQIWEKFIYDRVYKPHLTSDSIVIDIGANYGSQTVILSQMCKKVYAFEPQTFICDCLKKTLILSGIKNVELYNLALWDTYAKLKAEHGLQKDIEYGKDQGSSYKMFEREDGDIQGYPLDSMIDKFEYVDLIKIDAETAEFNIIGGAIKTIKKWRPIIALEAGELELENIMKLHLSPIGYKLIELDSINFLATPD